jgi:hypothetical protein
MFRCEGGSPLSDTTALRAPPGSSGARALVTAATPGSTARRLRRPRTTAALWSAV